MGANGTKRPRTPVEELGAAEREIRAMKKIGQLLQGLSPTERSRTLSWAIDHYGEPGVEYSRELEPGHERVGG